MPNMATGHTEAAAGAGFGEWVRGESRSLYLRASALIAAVQLVNSMLADVLRQRTPAEVARGVASTAVRWLPVWTHVFQLAVILILLAVLMRESPAGLASTVRDRARLLDLQERFRVAWVRVWVLWLLLYLGLFAFAFLKQVEIDALAEELPRHVAQQYAWFNRMHEAEDIREFSRTLAIGFDDIKREIAREHLGVRDDDRGRAAGRPWAERALGIHDLPYLVRDDRQVELLKDILYYVSAEEAAGSPGPPGRAGRAAPDGAADARGAAELGDRLPDYLDRVGLVDRLTTTLKIERTLTNLLNNMQTWQFLICYLILLRPRRDARFPYEIGVMLVGIVAVVETTLILTGVGGSTALQAFRALSALGGGVTYALFVGRLESRPMRAPLGLIAALYAYAVLQMGWGIEPTDAIATLLNSVLYFSYAVFKILMFLFVLWLLRSGVLLHYFHYRLHAEGALDHSLGALLKGVVPPGAAAPEARSG